MRAIKCLSNLCVTPVNLAELLISPTLLLLEPCPYDSSIYFSDVYSLNFVNVDEPCQLSYLWTVNLCHFQSFFLCLHLCSAVDAYWCLFLPLVFSKDTFVYFLFAFSCTSIFVRTKYPLNTSKIMSEMSIFFPFFFPAGSKVWTWGCMLHYSSIDFGLGLSVGMNLGTVSWILVTEDFKERCWIWDKSLLHIKIQTWILEFPLVGLI